VALGFATLRKDVTLAGVVLNRVASPRHEALARAGIEAAGIRVLGSLPRRPSVALPERHLGLVQAEEQPRLAQTLAEMADFIAAHVDLAALRAIAARTQTATATAHNILPPGNRVALARDAAFSFIYPHLLAGWRAAGAEILPFSPLADEAPDASADACWLPGGYPELHAGRLAAAARFRSGLQSFAETRPVHGECGGYMAMGEGLIDASGVRHQMAGFFKLTTSFEKRRMHLGYRLAALVAPIPGHCAGARLRGHEFHYASILEHNDAPLAHVVDASGAAVPETGSSKSFDGGGRATGSFFHLIAEAT
jgi:cobyrinic acid a,c-diamide synthase